MSIPGRPAPRGDGLRHPVARAAGAVLAGAVLAAGLSGCSPRPSPAGAGSSSGAQAPTSPDADLPGVALTELGFRNGPEGFTVPAGLVLSERVDQTDVVTLITDGSQGRRVHDYLMAALPSMGWTIEGSSGDSIVFSGGGWQGAFTMTDEQAGLTLRRQE